MKLALIGYGKMGKTIERIARERGHLIVSIIDIDNQEDFTSEAFSSADAAIEFTAPQMALKNIERAFAAGVSVVSGTTGWSAHRSELADEAIRNNCALFLSSNFSLGVNIFMALNRYLAKLMNAFPDYNVEINEVHHVHKLDAPSGTAITLAERIIENMDRKTAWAREREDKESSLAIKSVRRGEVPGIHTVSYWSAIDKIEITHDAASRDGFALGAVVAAEYTAGKQGLLTMEDLFA
jgi:4-hydroxy-tetrahydrodipicolinate reductase